MLPEGIADIMAHKLPNPQEPIYIVSMHDLMAHKLPNPQEPIYIVSMHDLLLVIAKRMGKNALTLTTKDLLLARDEVQAALSHNLDEREYFDMGLEAWELARGEGE